MTDRVVREGGVVRRPLMPWSPSIHHLLDHLAVAGFPSPRFLGTEGDSEILTWIEGESGPQGWGKVVPELGLRKWGRFLRQYHDAVMDFRPPDNSPWSSGTKSCTENEIVCHGDFGPWNAVWNGTDVVGLIDWDHARPATNLFDVAYALEYVAPFRDDAEAMTWMAYPRPPDRRRRIEAFCDSYGIAVPTDVVAMVEEQQRATRRTVEQLARDGIEPQ